MIGNPFTATTKTTDKTVNEVAPAYAQVIDHTQTTDNSTLLKTRKGQKISFTPKNPFLNPLVEGFQKRKQASVTR
jgi:hypothetical protein